MSDEAGRFWAKVTRASADACWPWTAAVTRKGGYGRARFEGKVRRAHRVAWVLTYGPVPPGTFVLHHCDNPPCCNPGHLFLGDNGANMRDMVAKGRSLAQTRPEALCRGADFPAAKLDDAKVRAIRAAWFGAGETQRTLARRYGVSRRAIQFVLSGKTWRDV